MKFEISKMSVSGRSMLAVAIACLLVNRPAFGLQDDLPSAEKVIAAYIEATGGEMKHKEVTAMRTVTKMTIEQAGMEAEIKSVQKDGKGVVTIELPGIGKQSMGYDGETAWQTSDMTGPEIVEGEARDQMIMQFDASPMINLTKFFDTIKCTGVEDFHGEKCYVVVCEKKDRNSMTHYFSVESGLHAGTRMVTISPQGEIEIENQVSDYRDVNGIKVAYKTEATMPFGTMMNEITSIEINPEIADSELELPDAIKELKK